MPYQITYTTTFANGAPPYDEWVAAQTSKIFPTELMEQVGTKTPIEVLNSRVTEVTDPSKGFISSTITSAGNVNTLVELWETQADAIAAQDVRPITLTSAAGTIAGAANSDIITGTGTSFTTDAPVGYVFVVTLSNVLATSIGIIKSVESDTSLTLVNPVSATNVGVDTFDGLTYIAEYPTAPSNFLYSTYSNTYIVSTEVTTANI